jgi:flagellar hook-associated protein 1 FlgK
MTNFGSKILNNATGALAAQQAVIAATSNNIANVNTAGYARRTVDLETRSVRNSSGGLEVGNGVQIGQLLRFTDQFLEKALMGANSEKGFYGIQRDMLGRAEQLFDLTGSAPTIGSTMSGFFAAADDLAADPASIPLRSNFIQRAQEFVDTIRETYNTIADLQAEADRRLATEIQSINSMTAQIANLNGAIKSAEQSGSTAADQRDQRDNLMRQLSEKVSFNSIEGSDGAVSVTLNNGFSLVTGTQSRSLDLTQAPSFATGPLPPSLNGGLLNYIVYDYDTGAGTNQINLTQTLQSGSGTVAGLLALRGYNDPSNTSAFDADGTLVDLAARVEGLAQQLLTAVNTEYLGPDRNTGTAIHDPSSGDLDGNTPAVYGLFSFTFSGTRDADGNGLPDDLAALGVDNFASRLTLTTTSARAIAAARDAGTGSPAAAVYASGDGRNMLALTALQSQSFSFAQGNYAFTGTFDQHYNETVGFVGIQSNAINLQSKVAEDKYVTAQNSRDEVSGVSLDEEFTTLIKFQKNYQAAAKLVKVAEELMDQIVGLI